MFEGFAKVWTPVMPSSKVGTKPVPMMVAGEKLVFFRGADGVPGALIDRCPHRGVALSLGTVGADGCITCPFHGWRFAGDGEARHVALNPDARREQLFARAVPVKDLGGLVWIYTDVAARNPPPPAVPDGLTDERLGRAYLEVEWKAHWTRAMENMLDSPHVPYVHKATIGRPMQKRLGPTTRMDVSWEPMPYGGRSRMTIDGQGGLAWLDFYAPNLMALHIPIPGKVMRMHAIAVPVDRERTRLLVVGARSFFTSRVFNPLFNWMNRRIVMEDKAVVESSDPPIVPRPAQEVSVASDRATLQFRKYYFDVLEGSTSTPPPRHGLRVHSSDAA